MNPGFLKLSFYGVIMSLALLNSNCGGGNSDLEISISPTRTFFLPGSFEIDDSDSCYEETTIAEPRFTVDSFTTKFSATSGSFKPIVLKISVTGNANVSDFTCAITGKQDKGLADFLFGSGETELAAGATKTMDACKIHCGGVSVTGSGSFSVSANVQLIGIHVDGTNQKPITKSATLTLVNAF